MRRLLVLLCLLLPVPGWGQTPINEGEFTTHTTNPPRFGTPLLTGPDGAIYVCYVSPALQTVITRKDPVTGVWDTPVLLPGSAATTNDDPFHTQCSIGQDSEGYLHAVYNMHNTPWQYARANAPHSIAAWTFLGQAAGIGGMGVPADAGCVGQCETDWLTTEPGIAAIPGNQITYPQFANDSAGALYVIYRHCGDCGATFYSRQWAMSIAKYTPATQTWARVGSTPWATGAVKLPIGGQLFGDNAGRVHVSWLWCDHYTEAEGGLACRAYPNFVSYAYSDDGGTTWRQADGTALTLPLTHTGSATVVGASWFDLAGAVGYFALHSTMMASLQAAGRPFVVVYPNTTTTGLGIVRGYVRYTAGAWTYPPVNIGYSPTLVYEDALGVWTAVSSGLRLHRSTNQGATWTVTALDTARGAFTVAYDQPYLRRTNRLRLYANRGASGLLVIWTIPYDGPPPLERVRLPRKVAMAEVCGNSLDDDYDGLVDEGC